MASVVTSPQFPARPSPLQRLLRSLRRPSLLVLLVAALATAAAGISLWPRGQDVRATPLRDEEQEIAWLYPATSASAWERFVTAVKGAAERLNGRSGTEPFQVDVNEAFPRPTSPVPEVALTGPGGRRLVFRWYKLTSDQKADAWVRTLITRKRQPLAFIGGSDSDRARELAVKLRDRVAELSLPTAPLLFLTTATADLIRLQSEGADLPLNGLYEGRTFRFCFTNRQMAAAVTEFVMARPELRPDEGPFYLVLWGDDPYSMDLTMRFRESLEVWTMAAWLAITPGTGSLPVNLLALCGGDLSQPPQTIDYSVGGFDQPNRWEGPTIEYILDTKSIYPMQRRPLLVLSAASSQPARRFLRGLARAAPTEAQRFVVATGDALPFNVIYRDRNIAWPVQELPFDLVFFCHRNPVERDAGFATLDESRVAAPEGGAPATGTEDLLLFRDIVEAVVRTANTGERPENGDALAQRLRGARWDGARGGVVFEGDHPLLFDDAGHRRSGTGEHVAWLRPGRGRERVRPQATVEVWAWLADGLAGRTWEVRERLDARYDAAPPGERGALAP